MTTSYGSPQYPPAVPPAGSQPFVPHLPFGAQSLTQPPHAAPLNYSSPGYPLPPETPPQARAAPDAAAAPQPQPYVAQGYQPHNQHSWGSQTFSGHVPNDPWAVVHSTPPAASPSAPPAHATLTGSQSFQAANPWAVLHSSAPQNVVLGSGKAPTAKDILRVRPQPSIDADWERFWFDKGFIVSKLNLHVLDIKGGHAKPGSDVILWPRKEPPSANQQWKIDSEGVITSELGDLCLDVHRVTYGAKLCVRVRSTVGDTQRWMWTEDGRIANVSDPNFVIGVDGGKKAEEAKEATLVLQRKL